MKISLHMKNFVNRMTICTAMSHRKLLLFSFNIFRPFKKKVDFSCSHVLLAIVKSPTSDNI